MFDFISANQLLADDVKPWPVDELIASEGVTLLYGPAAASGALALAKALAFRKPWLGRDISLDGGLALVTWRKERDTRKAMLGARNVLFCPETIVASADAARDFVAEAMTKGAGIVVVDHPAVQNFLDMRKLVRMWADVAANIAVVLACPAEMIDNFVSDHVSACLWHGATHVPGHKDTCLCTWIAGSRDAPDDRFIYADGDHVIPDNAIPEATRERCERQARGSLKWIADAAEKQFLSIADMESAPPPRFLVGSILPETSITFIYGAPKTGKSFLALSLALHIAAGKPWFGRPVMQGPVIYIAAEGSGGMGPRIAAAREAYDIPQGVPFKVMPRAVKLTDQAAVLTFIRNVANDLGMPVMVVVDTLSRSTGGADENAVKEMTVAIERADDIKRAFGCNVVIVHHGGKDATKGLRGSNAFEGAADCIMQVTRPTKEERDNGAADVVTVANTHQKDFPEFADLYFDMARAGPSMVLRERAAAPAKGAKPITEQQKAALALFTEMAGEAGGPVSVEAFASRAAEGLAVSTAGTVGERRKNSAKVLGALERRKLIRIEDGHARLFDAGPPPRVGADALKDLVATAE